MQKNKPFTARETCPLCGCIKFDIIVSALYTDPRVMNFITKYYGGRVPTDIFSGTPYEIRQCAECGLFRQAYTLNDSLSFQLYEKWIDSKDSLNKKLYGDAQLYRTYAEEMSVIISLTEKMPHEINVLDFGMGWGFWCRMAQAFNINVTGFELSKKRLRYAEKMGIKTISSLSGSKERYDFINAHQVFEHVSDPVGLLKELCRLLKSGGAIRLSTPNAGHEIKEFITETWKADKNAFHPLEHLNGFCKKTLIRLGETASLTEIENVPLSHPTQIYFRKP